MSAHKLSSDSDVPFFAFVGELDSPDDSPEGRLLTALGIPHGLPVRIHDITSRTHFAWNVSDFGDDPLSDYYSEDELTAYAETTALMRQHLTRLWMGSFAPVDVVYPVFWYGQSGSGNLVGVFSVRTDT